MTHQLSGSEPTPKEQWLPPPPVTRLRPADNFEICSAVEPHVEYRLATKDGIRSVRLQDCFITAYAGWAASKLPRAEAVLTLPFVRDGQLIGSNGLDREHRVIFRIDDKLVAALPHEPVPLATAIKSYQWLQGQWLKDAAFKDRGFDCVKALSLPLTVIERSLLNARPLYNVTGDVAGTGKTTMLNMMIAAVTGQPAPAAAWSDDPNERRKAIFSFCRESAVAVVFDNIKRGTVIDCAELAKLATAATIRDRVLKESRSETAPAKTVVAFDGNSISVRGDLASRTITVEFESPTVDPANRDFEHEDPVAWTVANRLTILTHLFNILLVERARPRKAQTRFKLWWRLVGHPLELVANAALKAAHDAASAPLELEAPKPKPAPTFDFGKEIRDNVDEDEETVARTWIIQFLWNKFLGQQSHHLFANTLQSANFTAGQVAALLPKFDDPTPSDEAKELAANLRTAANQKFAYTAYGVSIVLKKHVTGWVKLADKSTARLVSELDTDSNTLMFHVEKRN